ncbi:GAF domain-containing protein [Chitinophaga barathri]|uniref:GAF domain-containing protein n=1 Tax=Chitinophaga barathri TaxID=1647451 RepID=A0A3N4MJT8_9BACT|nr:GAF domain-containing protein [Chitinophaga barathri]RPD39859.1 GAF domain-containing protein [Chitinophaga barathri]
MINGHCVISFNYPLDSDTFIFVKAEVMHNTGNGVYLVYNFRSHRGGNPLKLPTIEIRLEKDRWVHADSETPTLLSEHAGKAISSTTQLKQEVLEIFLERAMRVDHADFGNIQLLDRSTQTLWIAAQKGFGDEFLEHFKTVTACGGSACGNALRQVQAIVIPDVLEEDSFAAHRNVAVNAGFRSVMSVPIMGNNNIIGVLSVHSAQPFKHWQIREGESIAAEIGQYFHQGGGAE